MTNELTLCKADGIAERDTPDTIIRITDPMPDLWRKGDTEASLQAMAEHYDEQAAALAQTLLVSLPGGTLDHLVAKLLVIKASHFRVAHTVVEAMRTEQGES